MRINSTLTVFAATGVFALLTAASPAAASFEYVADDGTGSVNVGPAIDGQMLWGNYFYAEPDRDIITTISVAFGNIAIGREVTLLLFDDPDNDGNPDNATLLTQTTGLTDLPQSNEFIDFAITPTQVTGGFFVAAMMDIVVGDRPGRLDPQTVTGQSWISAGPSVDLNNLGGSLIYLNMQNNAVPGNWMVRATAIPSPAGLAVLLCGTLAARRRRR